MANSERDAFDGPRGAQPGGGSDGASLLSSPTTMRPVTRDHVAAGLLAIFLGWLGVHKFYLGYNAQGFILLAVSLIGGLFSFGLAAGAVVIISIIEGVIYLTKSQSEFERTYVHGKREWF